MGLRDPAIDEMFKITLGKKAGRGATIFSANVSTSRVSHDCSRANVISYRPRIKCRRSYCNLARLRLARLSSRGTCARARERISMPERRQMWKVRVARETGSTLGSAMYKSVLNPCH